MFKRYNYADATPHQFLDRHSEREDIAQLLLRDAWLVLVNQLLFEVKAISGELREEVDDEVTLLFVHAGLFEFQLWQVLQIVKANYWLDLLQKCGLGLLEVRTIGVVIVQIISMNLPLTAFDGPLNTVQQNSTHSNLLVQSEHASLA